MWFGAYPCMLALLCAYDDPEFIDGADYVGTKQLTDGEDLQPVANSAGAKGHSSEQLGDLDFISVLFLLV